jgi:autotransporter-associated beta strand protein
LRRPSMPMLFRPSCFSLLVLILTLGWVGGVARVEGATTLYFNDFGTTTISGTSYTGSPTLDAAITSAVWTTSATGFTSFAGSSGQALSLSNSSGTPTITLTLTLDALYTLDLDSLSFWRQRSSTGAQNWSLSVNGTTVNNGTVPTTGASTGSLTPSTTAFGGVNGLNQYVFQLSLSGASGTGTFRLDDFTLMGAFSAVSTGSDLFWVGGDTTLGGAGTWVGTGGTAWRAADTDGAGGAWDPAKRAVFGGTSAGTVTIDGTVAASAGLAFNTTGYTLSGGTALDLTGATAANSITTADGVTATIETNLTGAAGMTKAGLGTLVLVGDKTYTGGTTISGGTLALGNGTDNGSIVGAITNNAALAVNNGSAQTLSNDISGTGSLTKSGAGTLTLSGTNGYSGGTTVSEGGLIGTTSSLQGAITNNAAVTFDQASNGTYAGNMTGSGSLTKLGEGTVTLSGTNGYTGGTTVTAGRLIGTTDSLQGAITNNAAVTFDQTTDGTYAGIMSGSGSLTKSGAGAVTLSGANDFAGGTTLAAGKLIGTHDTAFGTGDITLTGGSLLAGTGVTVANEIIVNAPTGGSVVVAYWNFNSLSIATASAPGSGGVPTSLAADQGAGTLSLTGWTGTVDDFGGSTINSLNSDAAEESLSLLSNAGNGSHIQISGLNLTGLSDVRVTFATRGTDTGFNSGQWAFSNDGTSFTAFGSNTATRSTTFSLADTGTTNGLDNIATGFLRYVLDGATNTTGNNRIDNLQVTATAPVIIPVLGSEITSGTATFSGNVTLQSNVSLTAAGGGTSLFTGQIANGSNGARGIEKVGAGWVELTGANTYSGGTTISAGTLAVNNTTGSGTGTGNVVVKTGGTLAGTGTLSPTSGGSILFEAGSTVSVGTSGATTGQQLNFIPDAGTITTTFASGSTLVFDLFSNVGDNTSLSAAADRLFLNGAAVFEGNVTLRVNTLLDSLLFAEGNAWKLLDWSSLSITGNTANLIPELPALSGTLSWDTSQLFTTGSVTIVPEPSRALLAGLGLLCLGLRRRRVRP